MALDGIVISNIVYELNNCLIGGRLYKIAQPEPDELLLTIKNNSTQYRLTISANGGLPLIYLTDTNKTSPVTAPNFCMLLRKHINNGRIVSITQPGLERVIDMKIEHLNELGDLCKKHLIVELMGKHSNIIFCDDESRIIDSIRHVSVQMSSVREVLPGRNYFIPETSHKLNPIIADEKTFQEYVFEKPAPVMKALYSGITGISPNVAEEICYRAGIDSNMPANCLKETEQSALYHAFCSIMDKVKNNEYFPAIIYKNKEPIEFSSIDLSLYQNLQKSEFDSISKVLHTFYAEKNAISRIRQRSSDLRKIVTTALERNYKKYDLQLKQLKDTEKKEKYRIYGELLNTYGYNITPGTKKFQAMNYYTNEYTDIPLDDTLTPKDNAIRYFEKYNKMKRTEEALNLLISETKDVISHLESISTALDIAVAEDDLIQLKEEMIAYGYMKRKGPSGKRVKITSKPFHYLSSDNFDIYVGKNNFQNEELTFKFANGKDWWFHAKNIPGSHVIVKTQGEELTDQTFEEAASLAAYYSKARNQEKVEIDYTERRNIKKPNAAKPGFVIYHTNYSMVTDTDISGIQLITN